MLIHNVKQKGIRIVAAAFLLLALLLSACTSLRDTDPTPVAAAPHPPLDPTYAAFIAAERDPDVPDLPFPDNPDPSQCGIPIQWGDSDNTAWLSGVYDGELIQPTVLLYESHLRLEITGEAPHGTEVEVVLYQQNPVTDYYMVKVVGAEQPTEGWVPAPFLSFAPVQ